MTWQLHSGTMLDPFLTMDNVLVGTFRLDGITKKEAKEILGHYAEIVTKTPLEIQILDETVILTPEEMGIAADTDSLVNTLFRNHTTGEVDIFPHLGLDYQKVQQFCQELGKQYNQSLNQTTCAIAGTKPDLTLAPAENEAQQVLTITLGTPEYGLDTDYLYHQIMSAYLTGEMRLTAVCRELEPAVPDLEQLYEQTYLAPVDAVMDSKTFQITPEVWGYGFDLENAKSILENAKYGQTIEIPFQRIQPEATAETVGGHLFRDILGEARTPYKGADSSNRNTNLALACAAINGVVLMPGEVFSYNETLGERTAAKGYKPAPSYEGGLTVDTLGGGICQISSTLYYSTLFADLKTVRRYNHGYVSDYIDPGMDATVTWGGADLKFQNNTNYPIRIEAWRADGYVNVKIYGTDERDYYVKMTYEVISTTGYDKVYEEMTADNEHGYKDGDTIVTPYRGMTAKAYKEKYSKATNELISREQESHNVYKKRDWVVCKIVEATTSPETT